MIGNALGLPDAFVIGEEKRAIFIEGPADSAAKLVALEGGLWGERILKEIAGIESTVAEKFVDAPMKRIGARASDGINDATGRFAVLRGIVAGEDGELLDGVDAEVSAEHAARGAVGVIVEADAVQTIVILLRAGAGNGELLSEAAIAAIGAGGEARLRLIGVHARLEGGEVGPTAAI